MKRMFDRTFGRVLNMDDIRAMIGLRIAAGSDHRLGRAWRQQVGGSGWQMSRPLTSHSFKENNMRPSRMIPGNVARSATTDAFGKTGRSPVKLSIVMDMAVPS